MKKLRSQHYMLLILSITAICSAILGYIFMYHDTVRKAQEEANVKAKVSAVGKHILDTKNEQNIYDGTSASRAELSSFLVSADNAVPFINTTEAIGPTTGTIVSISSISSGVAENSTDTVVTAAIHIDGTWANVMRAVQMVENMPYAISVKNISLNESGSHWTAAIDISVLSS